MYIRRHILTVCPLPCIMVTVDLLNASCVFFFSLFHGVQSMNMRTFCRFWLSVLVFSLLITSSPAIRAQTWTRLTNPTPFQASQALLLTDGTVLCQNILSSQWFKLKPDQFGSYINGNWSQGAS